MSLQAYRSGKEPEPERPADSGLVEKAGTHLGQIDVSLSGDPAVLDSLRAEDFEVRVLQRIVEGAIVDRVCAPDDSRPQALAPPGIPASASPSIESRTRPATHLFYFDQPHLTMAGRQRAIDLAREMIPGLVRDGNRGILVSDGQRFETLAGPTSDAAELVAAEQLAREGITAGCGNGKYCPNVTVTRDQMAVFLVRTFGLP